MKMAMWLVVPAFIAPVYSQSSLPAYMAHATITHDDAFVHIHANSPRPVEQALSAIRREYGLVLDYEEGPSSDPGRFVNIGGLRRWKGGDYTVQLPEPDTSSITFPKQFIANVLSEFAADGARNFVAIYGVNNRITAAPSDVGARILDSPIVIAPVQRTIDQTVDAILSAIANNTKVTIERGGLVDNELDSRQVVVGNESPVAARILLEEALDYTTFRRYWILGWDPSRSIYAINIQTVIKVETTPSGQTHEIPVR